MIEGAGRQAVTTHCIFPPGEAAGWCVYSNFESGQDNFFHFDDIVYSSPHGSFSLNLYFA